MQKWSVSSRYLDKSLLLLARTHLEICHNQEAARVIHKLEHLYTYLSTFTSPSSITVQAATGGQTQTLYTSPTYAVTGVRAVTPTTLLFLIDNVPITGQQADTSHNGWWKMNTDGTGVTRLATSTTGQSFRFDTDSQYP